MTKKEHTIKLLLTTVKTHAEIAVEVGSTAKSVAFYSSKLQKIDKTCLAHRKSAQSESVKDLLVKYKS